MARRARPHSAASAVQLGSGFVLPLLVQDGSASDRFPVQTGFQFKTVSGSDRFQLQPHDLVLIVVFEVRRSRGFGISQY